MKSENEPQDNDLMSQPQRSAICKAYDSLGEHFDSVLIVVNFDTNTGDDGSIEEAHEGYWTGGAMTAIGLAEFAKTRIMASNK